MIKSIVIEVEDDQGKLKLFRLNSAEAVYVLQYVKDLNALFYYLNYVL